MGENFYYEKGVKGRIVNGYIYAIPIQKVKKVSVAATIDDKLGISVSYTGMFKALIVSDDARKNLGIKSGDIFKPNHYVTTSPYSQVEGRLVRNDSYPGFQLEPMDDMLEWQDQNKDHPVPPAALIHWEQVAFLK